MPSDSDELDEFAVPSFGGPSYSNYEEVACSSFVQVVTQEARESGGEKNLSFVNALMHLNAKDKI
jgi:hypothetical protein